MKLRSSRLAIYAKDISLITGKSERSCRKMLAQMRRFYKKEPHQDITIYEFCNYKGYPLEDALRILGW